MKENDIRAKNKQTDIDPMDQDKEKSEVQTAGGEMKTPMVVENSEVKAPVKRKYHTVAHKLKILEEADRCRGRSGEIVALLRREGLYSSTLANWRKQRREGTLSELFRKRGRKLKWTAEKIESEKWKKRFFRVEEKCRQLMVVIEAQKKISEILGVKQVDTSHLEEFEE